jgi:hypothetical protein
MPSISRFSLKVNFNCTRDTTIRIEAEAIGLQSHMDKLRQALSLFEHTASGEPDCFGHSENRPHFNKTLRAVIHNSEGFQSSRLKPPGGRAKSLMLNSR